MRQPSVINAAQKRATLTLIGPPDWSFFSLSGLSIFFQNAKGVAQKVEMNLKNPVKGIKSVPKDLGKMASQVKNMVGTTSKGIKSLTKK